MCRRKQTVAPEEERGSVTADHSHLDCLPLLDYHIAISLYSSLTTASESQLCGSVVSPLPHRDAF